MLSLPGLEVALRHRKEAEGMKASSTSIHEPWNNDYWIRGHETVYHWFSWERLWPCHGDRDLAIGPDTFREV